MFQRQQECHRFELALRSEQHSEQKTIGDWYGELVRYFSRLKLTLLTTAAPQNGLFRQLLSEALNGNSDIEAVRPPVIYWIIC